MPQTLHFVQRFTKNGRRFVSSQPERCDSAEVAIRRGKLAASQSAGVVIFSLLSDPEFGDIEDPVVVATFGETPYFESR